MNTPKLPAWAIATRRRALPTSRPQRRPDGTAVTVKGIMDTCRPHIRYSIRVKKDRPKPGPAYNPAPLPIRTDRRIPFAMRLWAHFCDGRADK
jgi:hypothetical protein